MSFDAEKAQKTAYMIDPKTAEGIADLERQFRVQAERDGDVFLPNMRPKGPVDFVFVGMEPSLGRWARTQDDARRKIADGFKNFTYSVEDFLLHFAIQKYLLEETETYHLTDVSKGAMRVKRAEVNRYSRYKNWIPLLKAEIDLLRKPGTRVIAIGKIAEDVLDRHGMSAPRLLHYSSTGARHRLMFTKGREAEFAEFANSVRIEDIRNVAERILAEIRSSDHYIGEVRARLDKPLSLSRQHLLFIYKIFFSQLRSAVHRDKGHR